MFILRGQAVIFCYDRPAIAKLLDLFFSGIDHRLNGEDHAGFQSQSGSGAAVVQHLRLFMEVRADTMTAKLAHHAVAHWFDEALNRMTDIAQVRASLDRTDAAPQGLIGGIA